MKHTRILPAERPYRACAAIVARYPRCEIEALAEALIESLDGFDDNEDVPDFRPRSDGMPGDADDHEPGGDEEEAAWAEPRTLGSANLTLMFGHEDAEDDDPAGQYDEDAYTGRQPKGDGPGCLISDNDYEHCGKEPQATCAR